MRRRHVLVQTDETSKHLLRHYDFSNMGFSRLLALQKHLGELYQTSLRERKYVQARDTLAMKNEVDDEINEQSRALDAFCQEEHCHQLFSGEPPPPRFDPETARLVEEMKKRHNHELATFDTHFRKTGDIPFTRLREEQEKQLMRRRLRRRQKEEMKAMLEKREMQQIAASWCQSRPEPAVPVFTTEVPRGAITPDPRGNGILYKQALARSAMRRRR